MYKYPEKYRVTNSHKMAFGLPYSMKSKPNEKMGGVFILPSISGENKYYYKCIASIKENIVTIKVNILSSIYILTSKEILLNEFDIEYILSVFKMEGFTINIVDNN